MSHVPFLASRRNTLQCPVERSLLRLPRRECSSAASRAPQGKSRLAALLFVLLLACATQAHAQWLFGRLVPDPPETQANNHNSHVDVSSDGKTVVFTSAANNWAPNSDPQSNYVVVTDLDGGLIQYISRTTAGTPVRGERPMVSGDGRYVAFLTYNSNLGVGIPTPGWQVVRKDRVSGQLVLASANASGSVAADAVEDDSLSMSGNGRYVAFGGMSTNLGIDPKGSNQVFVKDLSSGTVILASAKPDGTASDNYCALYPRAQSDDGRFIVFTCQDPMATGGGYWSTYMRDLAFNHTSLISRANGSNGVGNGNVVTADPAISPNGRLVVLRNRCYGALGGDCVNNSGLYVRDVVAHTTTVIPKPVAADFDACRNSDISDIGTVLMTCTLSGVDQVYLHIPGASGTPFPISSNDSNIPGNLRSGATVAMDAAGLSYAFESQANNLVPGDTNNATDIFMLVDSDLINALFSDGFE